METDKTYPAPTFEELVFLLEKQDAMLESLMAEMPICKEQVDYLRKKNEVQEKESANDRGELMDAHKRMADLVKSMKALENENGNLQRRISELEAHSSIRPAQSVLDLQEKLREKQFELERRDRTIETIRSELERDRSRNEQLEKDLNSAHKSRNELANTLNSRIESLSKDLAQAQLEAEDFRCFPSALTDDFSFRDILKKTGYALVVDGDDIPNRCTNKAKAYYPILRGADPMMPFYNTMYEGIYFASETDLFFLSRMTPIARSKEYCVMVHLIADAFLEYWEKFHSDSNLCSKMVEFIKFCHVFRQAREMFTASMHEKLCLSEDGCFNVMKYYDDELPFCVKYTAIREFKNTSIGSWHHTIINYCKLTEIVPEAKAEKYDQSILTKTGRTRESLREMCLFLRYRLLPEEGKEQEIPEDAVEYDTETTTDYKNGIKNGISIYNMVTKTYWIMASLILSNV